MRQEYQPEMKSCPTNIGLVFFYDTVALVRSRDLCVPRARKEKTLSSAQLLD